MGAPSVNVKSPSFQEHGGLRIQDLWWEGCGPGWSKKEGVGELKNPWIL